MVAPIIIRNPILTLTKLVDGTPTGSPVDVSDDVAKVELAPTIPTSTVSTFSGKYQTADDVEWAGTASIVVNSLPKILEVAPGLHTMRDMPIPSYFGG